MVKSFPHPFRRVCFCQCYDLAVKGQNERLNSEIFVLHASHQSFDRTNWRYPHIWPRQYVVATLKVALHKTLSHPHFPTCRSDTAFSQKAINQYLSLPVDILCLPTITRVDSWRRIYFPNRSKHAVQFVAIFRLQVHTPRKSNYFLKPNLEKCDFHTIKLIITIKGLVTRHFWQSCSITITEWNTSLLVKLQEILYVSETK